MFKTFIDRILDKAAERLLNEIKSSDHWHKMIVDLTKEIDVQDIANGVDMGELANHIEVDAQEVAENVEASEVADYIDTDAIASEVMQKIASQLEALV